MKTMIGLMPHEILKVLRTGEELKCRHCKGGVVRAVGDYKKTNTFRCDNCKKELIVN